MQWFSTLNLLSPVPKRGIRTPIHALNFNKSRSSTPNAKNSSSPSATNNHCTSPPAKRSRPNFNVEVSLISQNNQTDWFDSGRTPAPAPSFPNLLPSIKTRRPSDSSDECGKMFCWICQERRPGQEVNLCFHFTSFLILFPVETLQWLSTSLSPKVSWKFRGWEDKYCMGRRLAMFVMSWSCYLW